MDSQNLRSFVIYQITIPMFKKYNKYDLALCCIICFRITNEVGKSHIIMQSIASNWSSEANLALLGKVFFKVSFSDPRR